MSCLRFANIGAAALALGGLGEGSSVFVNSSLAQTEAAPCTPTVAQTEGPYYLNLNLLRRDITEGRPGMPLTLRIQVVDSIRCAPLAGKAVDLWHADASGVYSGVSEGTINAPSASGSDGSPSAGKGTFLRGTQITDEQGFVEFRTIYPGWYPGRTTHIHYKVHLDPSREFSSQIYFNDALNGRVYQLAPYSAHAGTRTLNANDRVLNSGTDPDRTVLAQGALSNNAVNASIRVVVEPYGRLV